MLMCIKIPLFQALTRASIKFGICLFLLKIECHLFEVIFAFASYLH
jgi:type IV secretory pathway VirB3-like protein